MPMAEKDWERPEVKAMCEGCCHWGQCPAALVVFGMIDGKGECPFKEV